MFASNGTLFGASLTIIEGVTSRGDRILYIHYLQRGSLSRPVAQAGETQAFRCQIGSFVQRYCLGPNYCPLVIERIQVPSASRCAWESSTCACWHASVSHQFRQNAAATIADPVAPTNPNA